MITCTVGSSSASSQASRALSTASFTVVSSALRLESKPSRWRFLAKNSLTEISRCLAAISWALVSPALRRRPDAAPAGFGARDAVVDLADLPALPDPPLRGARLAMAGSSLAPASASPKSERWFSVGWDDGLITGRRVSRERQGVTWGCGGVEGAVGDAAIGGRSRRRDADGTKL